MDQIVDTFFQLLEQLILPNWPDLIELLPWVLIALMVMALISIALVWRRTSKRNRSRVPRRLAGGAPPPGVHMPGPSIWPFVAPIGAAILLFAFVLPPTDAAGKATAPFNFELLMLGLIVTLVAIGGWLYQAMHEWRATDKPVTAHSVSGPMLPSTMNAAVALPAGGTSLERRAAAASALAAGPIAFSYPEPPPGVHMPGPSPWPFFAPLGMVVTLYGAIFSSVLIVGGIILLLIAMTGWYLEAGHEYRTTEEFGHAVPATRDPQKVWPRRLVPVYGTVIAISFAITLVPTGLSFLNSLTPAKSTPTPITVPAQPVIEAKSIAFNLKTLVVPAGRPFQLVFDNNDAGVPHNVQIDDSPARASTLFDGAVETGVISVTYDVPALPPGTYYFLCKVHPNMNGTVIAAPETGGSGPASPAP